MFARNTLKGALLAIALVTMTAGQGAIGQNPQLTPEGSQTPAPSQMPQQPTLEQEYANPSNQNLRVSPPSVGVDMPGTPGVELPGRKAKTGPGGTGTDNQVQTPRTGGIVYPQGIPSSVRIGPVHQTPLWQRGLLATWLTLQLLVLLAVAIALQIFQSRFEKEHGGHIINPETTEATNLHRHAPHTP